jgi:hypothetical protein
MNTFTPFTDNRKAMIKHVKAFLTNKDNLKRTLNLYGKRVHHLCFRDYVVYAVLRGADYKKTSHMQDGQNAREELLAMLKVIKDGRSWETYSTKHYIPRYCPEGAFYIDELEILLENALNT